MTQPHTHHIRKWSQSARVKGVKVQTFCWECQPCGKRVETTSRAKRNREAAEHEGKPS